MENKSIFEAKLNQHGPLVLQIPRNIDFYIDKIENGESFSLVRRQSEWWWVIRAGLRGFLREKYPNLHYDHGKLTSDAPAGSFEMGPFEFRRGIRGLGPAPDAFHSSLKAFLRNEFLEKRIHISQEFYDGIARHAIEAWDRSISRGRDWKFNKDITSDLIRMVCEPKPEGFIFAVHQAAHMKDHHLFPDCVGSRWGEVSQSWWSILIGSLLPAGEKPHMSTVWREWARTGSIDKLFKKFGKDDQYKIVVVGPPYFESFGKRANLQHFDHIPISHTKAAFHVGEYYNQIITKHTKYLTNHDKVIYFFNGGDAVVWLMWKLHGKLDNAYAIEAGRALDVYYFYDKKTYNSFPQWQWGTWLKESPPTWLKGKQDLS
jgi:hypothetical protein